MRKRILFLWIGVVAGTLTACHTNNSEPVGTSIVRIRLTDAPGDFEAVNVDIRGIEIKMANTADNSDWTALSSVHAGVYNLLELTNGIDTLIGSDFVPTGQLSQIRLVLGENNSVQIDGKIHPLQTPSGQQSGLKLPTNLHLKEGTAHTILLDFDASRSVIQAGNPGKFMLKPVIRPIFTDQTGAISGIVHPNTITSAVYAIAGNDTIGTYTNAQGSFKLSNLPVGTYQILLKPNGNYKERIIKNVPVTLGKSTNVGDVQVSD
jgi:hypothetical protein